MSLAQVVERGGSVLSLAAQLDDTAALTAALKALGFSTMGARIRMTEALRSVGQASSEVGKLREQGNAYFKATEHLKARQTYTEAVALVGGLSEECEPAAKELLAPLHLNIAAACLKLEEFASAEAAATPVSVAQSASLTSVEVDATARGVAYSEASMMDVLANYGITEEQLKKGTSVQARAPPSPGWARFRLDPPGSPRNMEPLLLPPGEEIL